MNVVTFKVKTHKAYIKSMLNSSLQNTRKQQGKKYTYILVFDICTIYKDI